MVSSKKVKLSHIVHLLSTCKARLVPIAIGFKYNKLNGAMDKAGNLIVFSGVSGRLQKK